MTAHNDTEARQKIWDMIKDIHICLMVTQDGTGRMSSRPMGAQEHDANGDLWYFTEKNSPKIKEIEAFSEVLLSYSEPSDNNYVSIQGRAKIVTDKSKIDELWTEAMSTWFPKGKDDPNIALICVTPQAAEYWDAPSGAIVYAYGYVMSKITGEQPNVGENRKVNMAS